jgi:FkbM family methyltransferase
MIKVILKFFFSQRFVRVIVDFYGYYFDGYSKKSYSQEGEDMILQRLFEKQKTGFYVDVGAHHPRRFSNTYFFYKKGWCGINIDAMPNSMKRFNRSRPRDINIEKAISENEKILKYYGFNEPALNGFSKKISEERNSKNGYSIEFTKDIKTCTLENILDNNLPENQEIDFLTIDVEGLDFEVLKSNNFEKYRPKVILVELLKSSLSNIENNEINRFLENLDYSIYAKAVNTVFFLDKNQ